MKRHRLALVLLAAACSAERTDFLLPVPVSQAPADTTPVSLVAGFGRVDITPPPGIGLTGNTFEGRQAVGYRQRLYARAMVLADSSDHRRSLIFLVVDLGHNSPLLQRLTAARVARAGYPIGADRLILSTTHTHSGPGNYFEAQHFNSYAGPLEGYDPYMVEFLVSRFAAAVAAATLDLKPARASWDTTVVPCITHNRSLSALLLDTDVVTIRKAAQNRAATDHPTCFASLGLLAADDTLLLRRAVVDDTLLMLRVDQCDTVCTPRGAYSIFAMHGTGYPSRNDLVDADIQGIVERAVEDHIAQARAGLNAKPEGFFLLANGAEGDVSPDWRPESRCPDVRFRMGRRASGPRTPPAAEEWRIGEKQLRECLDIARHDVDAIGRTLAAAAETLFVHMQPDTGSHVTHDSIVLDRAFTTLDLQHLDSSFPVCPEPRGGTAQEAGAEDGYTRLRGLRYLWLFPSGFEAGGSAINQDRTGCQGAKQITLGPLQRYMIGAHGLPHYEQLAVVRVGDALLGAVPAEVTSVVGDRMKAVLRNGHLTQVHHVAIVGLANGYMGYVTTPEEYEAQSYEGGSNLYGPNTAPALTEQLALLAQSIVRGHPTVSVDSIHVYPGPAASYFPRPNRGPRPSAIHRSVVDISCDTTILRATWIDAYPGALVPAQGEVVEIQGSSGDTVRDDRNDVEVRAIRPLGRRGFLWEVRWFRDQTKESQYRVVPLPRPSEGVGSLAENDLRTTTCHQSSKH